AHALDVAAGGEDAIAGAGEDDRADGVIGGDVLPDRFELLVLVAAEGVARLGAVERDCQEPVLDVDLDLFVLAVVGHSILPWAGRGGAALVARLTAWVSGVNFSPESRVASATRDSGLLCRERGRLRR